MNRHSALSGLISNSPLPAALPQAVLPPHRWCFKVKILNTILTIIVIAAAVSYTANAQTDKPPTGNLNDQKLKITKKAPVSADVMFRCLKGSRNSGLLVRLKVTFHSSGTVTDVVVSRSSGCDYFDSEALRVAKKIKFKPEVKGGEAITVIRSVEYQAGIY